VAIATFELFECTGFVTAYILALAFLQSPDDPEDDRVVALAAADGAFLAHAR
jgi:hypothetical protein